MRQVNILIMLQVWTSTSLNYAQGSAAPGQSAILVWSEILK